MDKEHAITYLQDRTRKDPDSDCLLWTGKLAPNGYGKAKVCREEWYAHRLAYTLHVGPIPDGLFVIHSCDVRHCVNPDHLRAGTHQQNMDDRNERGRTAAGDRHWARTSPERLARGDRSGARTKPESRTRGDAHWSRTRPELLRRGDAHWSRTNPEKRPRGERIQKAKLNDDIVREIRRLYADGMAQVEIAKRYDVFQSTISQIIRGKTWTHVDGQITKDNDAKKLAGAAVSEIRARYANGETQNQIAADFDVSRSTVSKIIRGKIWADSGGPISAAARAKKLTEDDVREIRRRYAAGEMQAALGQAFGVSPPTISLVVTRRLWPHVE